MPYLLEDLVINRVDFVDEGANSAAFIELYKRKERIADMDVKEILSKMKPEHSAVIQAELDRLSGDVTKVNTALSGAIVKQQQASDEVETLRAALKKSNDELEVLKRDCNMPGKPDKPDDPEECECDGEPDENGMCKVCGKPKKKACSKPKKAAAFDEEETIKSLPEEARELFSKMRMQKEAAEAEVRKAREAEATAQAIAKANQLKALPVDTDTLVGVLKGCPENIVDVLTTINAAIEGTVLNEVGKIHTGSAPADAWSKIEAKAAEIAKRDSVTKQRAVAIAIKENPDLYDEYLKGGAN